MMNGMLVLTVAAAVLTLYGVLSGHPFIIYSPDSAWGIHIQAHSRTLSPQDAYTNITVSSICNCNVACKSEVRCMAASYNSGGDSQRVCYLAEKGPAETSVMNANGSHYIYRIDSLPAKHLGVKEDGLLYIVGNDRRSFTNSLSWCEKIPGFRLAIFKTTIQYPMIINMSEDEGKQLWIDLKIVGGDKVWGDGTIYEDTAISEVALMTQNNNQPHIPIAFRARKIYGFDDRAQSRSHYPLCQANPRGIEW